MVVNLRENLNYSNHITIIVESRDYVVLSRI